MKNLKTQLTSSLLCMLAEEPLLKALRHMRENNVGALVIHDLKGKPVGIFTERDLLKKLHTIMDYDGWNKPIGLVMTRPVITLPIEKLDEAGRFMIEKNVRHVPLTKEGQIVAIISMRDLFVEHERRAQKHASLKQKKHQKSQRLLSLALDIGLIQSITKILEDQKFSVIPVNLVDFQNSISLSEKYKGCIIDLDNLAPANWAPVFSALQQPHHVSLSVFLYTPEAHTNNIKETFAKLSKKVPYFYFMTKPLQVTTLQEVVRAIGK